MKVFNRKFRKLKLHRTTRYHNYFGRNNWYFIKKCAKINLNKNQIERLGSL